MKMSYTIIFAVVLFSQIVYHDSLQIGLTEGISGNGYLSGDVTGQGVISGGGDAIGKVVDGIRSGAGRIIGDIEKGAGELIDHVKDGAGNINGAEGSGEHQDPYWWTRTGRGIDWLTGIGSKGGIRTPIYDLLGLSKAICRVSNATEDLIENLGKLHMGADKKIGDIDRSVVNYVSDKFIKRIVDGVSRNHIAFVGFLVDTHVALDRFIYNAIIEAYRITKSPIRELFACH